MLLFMGMDALIVDWAGYDYTVLRWMKHVHKRKDNVKRQLKLITTRNVLIIFPTFKPSTNPYSKPAPHLPLKIQESTSTMLTSNPRSYLSTTSRSKSILLL